MKPKARLREIKKSLKNPNGSIFFEEKDFQNMEWLIKRVELLTEVMNEFRLGHEHNETCKDYSPLGDTYGWCSICSTKVSLNEDLARDVLDKEDFKF